MLMDGQGTRRRRKIADNFNRLSWVQTLQTDDRQRDETAIAYSEREREFTFAKKLRKRRFTNLVGKNVNV